MDGLPLERVPELQRGIVANMLRAPVYREAVRVLAAGDREQRAASLAQLPESIRALVEAEAKRVWQQKR